MGLDLLKLAGTFARDDQATKAKKIEERGKELAERKALDMEIAKNKWSLDEARYQKNFDAWLEKEQKLTSLMSSAGVTLDGEGKAVKRGSISINELATFLAELDGKTTTGLSASDKASQLDLYKAQIIGYDADGKVVADLNNASTFAFKNNPLPKQVHWGKDYFDHDKYEKAQDDIEKGTKGDWTTFIRGDEADKGDVVAALESHLKAGNDNLRKDMSTLFNVAETKNVYAGPNKELISSAGTNISMWDGTEINLDQPAAFPDLYTENGTISEGQKASWKIINDRFTQSTDENSGAFADNTQKALLASLTVKDVEVLGKWDNATGRIEGLKPEAAFLVSRADSIQNDVAIALYHQAGWLTGDTSGNSNGNIKDRFNLEIARRAIEVDTTDKWDGIANIFFLGGDPIAGTYLIPTDVLPVWKDLPEEVKHLDTGKLTNTQEYLQTVVTDIVKTHGEGKTTMGALTHIIDAEVFKILNQDATQEDINTVISNVVEVSSDGNTYTITNEDGSKEEDTFESLQSILKDMSDEDKSKIPENVMEKYKEWELKQNSGDDSDENSGGDIDLEEMQTTAASLESTDTSGISNAVSSTPRYVKVDGDKVVINIDGEEQSYNPGDTIVQQINNLPIYQIHTVGRVSSSNYGQSASITKGKKLDTINELVKNNLLTDEFITLFNERGANISNENSKPIQGSEIKIASEYDNFEDHFNSGYFKRWNLKDSVTTTSGNTYMPEVYDLSITNDFGNDTTVKAIKFVQVDNI